MYITFMVCIQISSLFKYFSWNDVQGTFTPIISFVIFFQILILFFVIFCFQILKINHK